MGIWSALFSFIMIRDMTSILEWRDVMNIVNMVDSQVIATVKRREDIETAIKSKANIVFLLTGNLLNMDDYIDTLQKGHKKVFLHLDFIEGLGYRKSAIEFIATRWKPDGIITTKVNVIKFANEAGLLTIQRLFLIDTSAIDNGVKMIQNCKPDAVEVLPGLMPSVIDRLTRKIKQPIIVGGLFSKKEEIIAALEAGALAVSSSRPRLWNFNL